MVYMTVEEHSVSLLHLKRSPGIRSWSLLVGKHVCTYSSSCFHSSNNAKSTHPLKTILSAGITSIGLAAAYYSSGAQTKFISSIWHNVPCLFIETSLCGSCRQHPLEAFLRDRLFVCSHAEHGGMGGSCVWQNQEPDWGQEVQFV